MNTTKGINRATGGAGESMGERLEKYLKQNRIPQAELSRMAGVKQQTINYLITRKSNSSAYAIKIATALGVNPAWLQEGTGGPHDPNALVGGGGVAAVRARWIPVLQMQELRDYIRGQLKNEEASRMVVTTVPVEERSFAMEVEGKANEPEFRQGDEIVVDPSVKPNPGDFVIAEFGGFYSLRKYRLVEASDLGEKFELVAINPDFPHVASDKTTISIVGTVVEHRRRLRSGSL